MVDVKNYCEHDDFLEHRKECELFFDNIKKYTSMGDKIVLDFGSGSGKHIGFLSQSGVKLVVALDIADNSERYNHEIKKSLCEYFQKYDYSLEFGKFECVQGDAQTAGIKNASVDIVFCMNAFEHIPDPEKALLEIHRVLKPGGFAFISFIAVWNSDIGSHMWSFVDEPWGHLKYSEDEYIEILKNATDGSAYWINEFKYAMNRLPRDYYFSLYAKYCENFKNFSKSPGICQFQGLYQTFLSLKKIVSGEKKFNVLEFYEWTGVSQEKNIHHDNFIALQKNYSQEELLFQGCYILLEKK
jgi:SAM-dependent methyltransferase